MAACYRCYGKGSRIYPSSAVWMDAIGGQVLTEGVCDRCWGSGDEDNPGENLRVRLAREKQDATDQGDTDAD